MKREAVAKSVKMILDRVRKEGDRALEFYSQKFDRTKLAAKDFFVPAREIRAGFERAEPRIKAALALAKKRIEFFHRRELERSSLAWTAELDWIRVGQIARPMDSAALYVPGGRFSYPSTVLMTAIPAKIAGVRRIVLATPKKNLTDAVLAAAYLVGVKEILCLGGPWAIAALGFGTKRVLKVDKIVGPGNVYVTEAKRQLFGMVGIEGLAGPSEIAVWADAKADPQKVALNLMAQAEHDPEAKSILFTTDAGTAREVKKRVEKEFLKQVAFQVLPSEARVLSAINKIAPEHLYLAIRNPRKVLGKIRNAGAIFLGEETPVPLGDYVAGPSHVLPTGGSARFASGLSVKDFLKWSSTIEALPGKSRKEYEAAKTIAEAEGLRFHALALRGRNGITDAIWRPQI